MCRRFDSKCNVQRFKCQALIAVARFLHALACRLAAAGETDLFLEAVEADRADHHLLADHVARRAVHAHRLGELEVFLDRGAHFGACKILLDPGRVEAGFLGRRHRARLVGGTTAAEQLLVKIEIFLAAGSCMRTATATLAASTEPSLSTGNSFSTTLSLGSVFMRSSMSAMARLQ